MIKINGNLANKIHKNYARMCDPIYSYPKVFREKEYEWQGDFEGRAILALVSLWKVTGEKSQNLTEIISHLGEHLNKKLYLGDIFTGNYVNEQHLSGHSWFVRGIVEYYLKTNDEACKNIINSIQNNYFLCLEEFYKKYPINRTHDDTGGVSGNVHMEKMSDWIVSTDIGCAYIALDAMSAIYGVTENPSLKNLIKTVIDEFCKIDKLKLRCQTHASLSACRGILRFYNQTNITKYLDIAIEEFERYLDNGMTANYANFNWYERQETWTEPCAIVDSLILSLKFYKITNDTKYLKLAYRIWYNALSMSQRDNGGAGCDVCSTVKNPLIKPYLPSYEAYFCCTMRLSEGLFELGDSLVLNQNGNYTVCFYDDYHYENGQDRIDICGNLFFDRHIKIDFSVANGKKVKFYFPKYLRIKAAVGMDYVREGEYLTVFENSGILEIDLDMEIEREGDFLFYGDLILCLPPANFIKINEYEKNIVETVFKGEKMISMIPFINLPFEIAKDVEYNLYKL